MKNDELNSKLSWAQLLKTATSIPGRISAAFRMFHNYSIGNQLLALEQCLMRGIQPGPIATFPAWKAKGRFVRKGERAIVLCMPISGKRTKVDAQTGEKIEDGRFTMFVYKPHWFVLSQTEGDDVAPEPIPGWDEGKALSTLKIDTVPFEHTDGNCLGYAKAGRKLAVSPVCPADERAKVLFHEAAHIVLGHCDNGTLSDGREVARSLREAEAEAVTLLCLETLNLPGADLCRGYIQHWYKGSDIPEKSAQAIFKAANLILQAGR